MALVDDFNRADQTGLGTSSGGGSWTAGMNGSAGFANVLPNIVSNQAQAVGGYRSGWYSALIGPNAFAGYRVAVTAGLHGLGVLTAKDGVSSRTGYEWDWNGDSGGWELYRLTGAGETLLDSDTTTFPSGTPLMRIRLTTTNVICDYSTDNGDSWTEIISIAEAVNRSASSVACFIVSDGVAFDNFFAGNGNGASKRKKWTFL